MAVVGDDLNVSNMQPSDQRQTRKADKCLVHPEFKVHNYFENDIAIVIVDVPFTETDSFEPAKLRITNAEPPIDNETCRIGKLEKVFLR